jgi:Domain of unknown function (DUF4833)
MHSARFLRVSGMIRRIVFAALLLSLFVTTASARASGSEKLFVIERSQNANYVQYDMQTANGGACDPREPVVAYWVMGAEKGQRESLGWAEKKAFGFSVKPLEATHGYELALKAYKGRSIGLYQSAGKWRAVMFIANKSAFLTRMFVQLRDGGLFPSVEYIDVFGEDVASGAPVRERLNPS